MGLGVLAYPLGSLARDCLGYELGLDPPALVSVLVHLTVGYRRGHTGLQP